MSDGDLDEFVAAFAARIDRDIVRAAPLPDIDDVWARVREIDETALPELLSAGTEPDLEHELASDVVPLARARALVSGADAELAPFAAALRDRIEGDLQEREVADMQARRAVRTLPPRRIGLVRASTAVLALAAALVLSVIGGTALLRGSATWTDSSSSRVEGRMLADGAWIPPTDLNATQRDEREPRSLAPVEPPAPIVTAPEPPPPTPRKPAHTESLDELEARAQALWQAGDLAGAEKLLREVIRRSRKGARVELAYGDLFAIARQRGGAAAQTVIWREYLRREPDGRFADDIHAGLCRRAAAEEASACWAGYLRERPGGAHVKEARKAGEGSAP